MQLWHSFVGDKKTGAMGFKQDFVLPSASLFVYGPDAPGYDVESSGEIPFLQEYEVINLFPKEVNFPNHTQDSAEPRKISVVFTIDNIYPVNIKGYNYLGANVEERYTSTPQGLGTGAGVQGL
jgi:hypothetical protein